MNSDKIYTDRETLYISVRKMGELVNCLRRKEIEQERIEKRKNEKEKLKNEIHQLIEKWPDTIEKLGQKNRGNIERMKKLRDEIAAKNAAANKEYFEADRKRILSNAKTSFFLQKPAYASLSKAFLLTHVQAENEAFIKHKKEIKERNENLEKKWDDIILRDVENYESEEREKKCKTLARAKMNQEIVLKQINERKLTELFNSGVELRKERENLIKMREEDEENEKIRKQIFLQNRRNAMDLIRKNIADVRKRNEEQKMEEKEQEMVHAIYNNFLHKKNCGVLKMRKKEQEERAAAAIKDYLKTNPPEKEKPFDHTQLSKMQEAFYRSEEGFDNKKKKNVEEQMQAFRDYQVQQNIKKSREFEMLKASIANRLKADEVNKNYDQQKVQELMEKKMEYMEYYKQQELDKKIQKESEKKDIDLGKIEDEQYFEYARQVLNQVRSQGRNDVIVRKEIRKYCRDRLIKNTDNCKELM